MIRNNSTDDYSVLRTGTDNLNTMRASVELAGIITTVGTRLSVKNIGLFIDKKK